MLKLPIIQDLENAKNILIAGAGGGYDVFCGLPLYFALRAEKKQVYLANLSFSHLPHAPDQPTQTMCAVTADSVDHIGYFPEKYLAEWFRDQGDELTIYAFERTGVQPLLQNYRTLIRQYDIDTVVLVDGGTDSLMRGDEDGLGTPHEDMTSITAVSRLDVARKLLCCLGFGVDHFHGVSNERTLAAVAELAQTGHYLGAFSLLERMPEARKYRAACDHVFARMPNHVSIVSSSILSAINGHYGDHHTTSRTAGSTLWINPLMNIYWCFALAAVAERILYRDRLEQTQSFNDVRQTIARFRGQLPHIQARRPLPD